MVYDALDSTPLERPRSLPQSYYGLVGDTINRRPAIILPRDSMSFGKYLRGARRQREGGSVRQLRGAVKRLNIIAGGDEPPVLAYWGERP